MNQTPQPPVRQWLFVLCNKHTKLKGWWLKLQSLEELDAYLELTNSRYSRAFQNYLKDSFYGPSVGHGPYIQEAGLTLSIYLRSVNRRESFIKSLARIAGENAGNMAKTIQEYGAVYINPSGGWNWDPGTYEPGDFIRTNALVWPDFNESDIRISQFPGGKHYYAYVGNTQISANGNRRFASRQDAEAAAAAYIKS